MKEQKILNKIAGANGKTGHAQPLGTKPNDECYTAMSYILKEMNHWANLNKFNGKNIMEVLTQMVKFLESLEQSITVQELIDALNKVEDKSKEVLHYDDLSIEEIEERDNDVILY